MDFKLLTKEQIDQVVKNLKEPIEEPGFKPDTEYIQDSLEFYSDGIGIDINIIKMIMEETHRNSHVEFTKLFGERISMIEEAGRLSKAQMEYLVKCSKQEFARIHDIEEQIHSVHRSIGMLYAVIKNFDSYSRHILGVTDDDYFDFIENECLEASEDVYIEFIDEF